MDKQHCHGGTDVIFGGALCNRMVTKQSGCHFATTANKQNK